MHVMLACDKVGRHYATCVFLQVLQVVLICKVRSNEVPVDCPSMGVFSNDWQKVFKDLVKPCKRRLVHSTIYRAGIRGTKTEYHLV